MTNPEGLLLAFLILISTLAFATTFGQARVFPLTIHNLIWFGAFLLIGMPLLYYDQISLSGWLYLSLGVASFNAGFILVMVIQSGLRKTKPRRQPGIIVSPGIGSAGYRPVQGQILHMPKLFRAQWPFWVLFALYWLCILVYLATIAANYGLDVFISNPERIRGDQSQSYMALVPIWARAFLYLEPLLFVSLLLPAYSGVKGPTAIRWLLALLVAGGTLLMLQRTILFTGLLWLIAAMLFDRGRISLAYVRRTLGDSILVRQIAKSRARSWTFIALSAAMAFGGFQLVGASLGKDGSDLERMQLVNPTISALNLTSPVFYATSGVVAFGHLTESTNAAWPPENAETRVILGDFNPITLGTATLGRYLDVFTDLRTWPNLSPFASIPMATNVYTWNEHFYRDFRAVGIAIGMFFFAGLLAWLFNLSHHTATTYFVGSLLFSMVFLATFSPRFLNTVYVVQLVCVFVVARIKPLHITFPSPSTITKTNQRK